jgi:lysophospholipase L1-like esterase
VRPFNIVILGDSIAWGQGLLPGHRWRELLVARLRSTLKRPVNEIRTQIHSGAIIGIGDRNEIGVKGLYQPGAGTPGEGEATLLDSDPYSGELPSATPTILAQLDALDALDPGDPIDLVVVSAGINDVRLARFLNPWANPKFVLDLIDLHCRRHLTALLDRIRVRCVDPNPACKVIVLSYFQMVSDQSTGFPSVYDFVSALFTAPPRSAAERHNQHVIAGVAKAEQFAERQAKPGARVSGALPDLVERIALAAKRFYDVSESAIDLAVVDANRLPPQAFAHVTPRLGPADALYVVPPDTSELWEVKIVPHEGPVPLDEVEALRHGLCLKHYGSKGPALNECDIAALGHPNVAGASDGYFEAMWAKIAPLLAQR